MGINRDNGSYAMYCAGVFTTKRKAVLYALSKRGLRVLKKSPSSRFKTHEHDDNCADDNYDCDGNFIYPYEYYDSLVDDHMGDFDNWDDLELRDSEFYLYEDQIDPLISDFNIKSKDQVNEKNQS